MFDAKIRKREKDGEREKEKEKDRDREREKRIGSLGIIAPERDGL